jgi:D-alanine-D-alanine ligase
MTLREGRVRRRLAVLMGGRSSEHEVSLSSAEAVLAALDPERYEIIPVLISREGAWSVDGAPVALVPARDGLPVLASLDDGPERAVDAVFPVLHGPNGEDGTVQGAIETAGAAYVGAGVAASAVAMDKAHFKVFLRDAGIPTPEHCVVTLAEWESRPDEVAARVRERVDYPAFCKPARLGSSVGISPVPGPDALADSLALAFRHDPKALVERAIAGREVEVGVLGEPDPVVSPVGEITYDGDWYDYDAKYTPGGSRLQVPADLPEPVAARARELALRAYRAVDCAGLARVDFFVTPELDVYLNEINTMPGFTPTSMFPRMWAATGLDYPKLVDRLIRTALRRGTGLH